MFNVEFSIKFSMILGQNPSSKVSNTKINMHIISGNFKSASSVSTKFLSAVKTIFLTSDIMQIAPSIIPEEMSKPKKRKYLNTPNTTSNSPIKPDVPGKPTEDKTRMINRTEKTGILLIKRL